MLWSAHEGEVLFNRGKCQTMDASPAEPRELPMGFGAGPFKPAMRDERSHSSLGRPIPLRSLQVRWWAQTEPRRQALNYSPIGGHDRPGARIAGPMVPRPPGVARAFKARASANVAAYRQSATQRRRHAEETISLSAAAAKGCCQLATHSVRSVPCSTSSRSSIP